MVQAPADEADIFQIAREITTPEARAVYLQQACGDDAALRERVLALLQVAEEQESFLEQPPAAYARTVAPQPLTEVPGTVIGPYKLLEQIGEGGFGVVFMAEQTAPVRRKVAIKVIKPGMDTRQVIARFEAERQALALMDHPHIAKVLDAGATRTGRPYFVMELVRGVPITDYCDEHELAPRERLELFVIVCQAVQHAHQKGIIHRDIKPTNVLITLHDDKPVVKVIDFGIAKATTGPLTDGTLYTGFAQLIGTPLYMSPEQASLSGLDVDTRSDVYSLGVVLYELLTGTTPFDKARLSEAAFTEIRRIIQEEEPPRPSTRISTLRNAETAPAAQRDRRPKQPGPMVLGELDWIVMKALEKDRNRRYESASALARDVERHLRNEPVQACPPSNWYRFRKFARRNKGALATAMAITAAVLVALGSLASAVNVLATSNARIKDEQELTSAALGGEKRANEDLVAASYFHRISLAHLDLSTGNVRRALKLLDECPEHLRRWEWRYLMRLCKVEPLVLQDNTEINGVAFSPDGERLASAGVDGTIKIWNSRTGDVIRTIPAHTDSVVCVVFHPHGQHVATRGADLQVRVWDWATGQQVFECPCDSVRKFGTAYTVAFSRDGRLLATGSDGVVSVWDWKHHQFLQDLPGHDYSSIPVAFSSDGRLATCTADGALKLWNPEPAEVLGTFDGHRFPVSALAFSPDGKWLASTSYDRRVKVWDTTTGELRHPLEDLHTGNVECVAFSPDGRRLVSGGEDKTVRLWDTTTGRDVLGLRGHAGRCTCLAFSPDARLASSSTDGTIRIWDATPLGGNDGMESLTFSQHNDEIRSVAYSPANADRQLIASAGNDGLVKVWDATTGRVSVSFVAHTLVVFCAAWHSDGKRIATAGSDGGLPTVRVWDAETGRKVFTLPEPTGKAALPYFALAFSPDGRYLVTGNTSGAVQVWDAGTGQAVETLGTHSLEIRGVAFSRDRRHLASASTDGMVKLWDATRLDEKQEARLTLRARVPGPSLNVAFSPDGVRLATSGEENTVNIWDVQTGEKLQTLRGQHSGEVYTLAFSPDEEGRWVATAGEDSAVKVWDSRTGSLVHSFRGHTGLVSSLAFDADCGCLVSGSRDTTVKVWDVKQLSSSEHEH